MIQLRTLALGLLLAACAKPAPSGEVIATVNGEDVTSTEVEAEAHGLGLQLGGPGGTGLRDRMVQRVIDRALLAQQAHRDKLDQMPAVMEERQRLDRDFLARLALPQVPGGAAITDADAQAYIAANPLQFAQRAELHLDQIRFSSTDYAAQGLHDMPAMGDIAFHLTSMHVAFEHELPVVDTATLPPAYARKLIELDGREPLIASQQGATTITSLVSRSPIQRSPEEQLSAARQALRQMRAAGQIDAHIAQLRRAAKIEYQPGYAPKPAGKS